jgi:hypothetical protein
MVISLQEPSQINENRAKQSERRNNPIVGKEPFIILIVVLILYKQ